jgi:hypothetical protein
VPPDIDSSISGWNDDELIATARENAGLGADADLPFAIRFRTNVTQLIRKRLANSVERGDPAVFFLLPSGPALQEDGVEIHSVPMLNNGLTPVEGHMWFVGPVAGRGLGIAIEAWSDENVFEFATKDLQVGAIPAILFETRTDPPEARYFPEGLADPDNHEILRLDASDISLSEILNVVDLMYERSLKTPDANHKVGGLWAKASKYWVDRSAEDRVEFSLREGLTGAFPSCVIRAEQSQTSGRLDLEVEEPHWDDPSDVTRHAILELKILRSYRSTGTPVPDSENVKAVADGVRQAASYRKERRSRASALCCFDMRETFSAQQCFTHVQGLAKRHVVTLRVWHIFNSSQTYRRHLIT